MASEKRLRYLHRLRQEAWDVFGYDSPEMEDVDKLIEYWAYKDEEDPPPCPQALRADISGLKIEMVRDQGGQPWDWRDKTS
ncbi:MAG: hypothetical protein ISN29_05100 [Gammaproteobacteria bacterium AqS3]|nr:hypothetical protein [Gammaproteobacteria bacterium AqS3]